MHGFTHLDKTRHGTPAFPVEYYYVDSHHPRYHMPFHWHNEWELLRVLEGTLQISMDDDQYNAGPGDILLIRGGMLHGGVPVNCVYECLVFDLYGLFRSLDMVKKYLRPFYRQTILPQSCFRAGNYEQMQHITDTLMSAFTRTDACQELEAVAGLARLFAWLWENDRYIQSPESAFTGTHRITQIKAVLEYIENHYGDGITLESLAGVVGMNPKYFCRVFSSLTHMSPMDYVNFYRIEKSAYLLDSTDLPITAVGLECGFSESSYFTKVFKKYKGLTPRDYRKSIA